MEKHIVVAVDWHGPFSLDQAHTVSRIYFTSGAYMAVGKRKRQHYRRLQYIGISSSDLYTRLTPRHDKLGLLYNHDLRLWLGKVSSTGVPGRKEKNTNIQLDLVEWAHAYYLDLPLNERKVWNPPYRSVTVVNRWWRWYSEDEQEPMRKRPNSDWPVLIDYRGEDFPVHICWHWDRKASAH